MLLVLAASIILLVSDFGRGGEVGNAISYFLFGVMGLMAYAFPVYFLLVIVFWMSNRGSRLVQKKLAAGTVFFFVLCGFLQLITEGYISGTTFSEYFEQSARYRTGGGVIGGALCMSTMAAFGTIGGAVIMVIVLLACLIIITQRSFFDFLYQLMDRLTLAVKGKRSRGKMQKTLREEEREREREARASNDKKMKNLTRGKKAQGEVREHKGLLAPKLEIPLDGKPDKKAPTEQKTAEKAQQEEVMQKEPPALHIHRAQDDIPLEPLEAEYDALSLAGSGEKRSTQELAAESTASEPAQNAGDAESRSPAKNPKSSPQEIKEGIEDIHREIGKKQAEVRKNYQFPPLQLLKKGDGKSQGDSDEHLRKTAQKLEETLASFGVHVTITNVSCGPTVTRYELSPEQGVKVSRIVGLADDIKLNLATADIRIEAPIPGKAAVGIEVPNKENSPVMLRDLLQSQEFRGAKSKLSFAAGKDIAGKPVVADIAKMPHLLIAGATGSGKSVCINTLIMSILYKARPEEVKMIMIDPKVVELSVYNGIPHLFIPVVTDPKKAAGALNWAVSEMTSRYNAFAEYGVRNLGEYNKKIENELPDENGEKPEKMPQIVIIVDELADLMMVAPGEVEDAICRLAQLARAAGIHLIIATQRPSVNVITGLIKANMPSRIAFSVSSGVDSRTILDMNGAEKLLGKGDMLFYPQGYQKPARLQGAFVSDEEVSAVVRFLSDKNLSASYDTQIEQQVNSALLPGGASGGEDRDIYFEEAGKFIIEKEKASIGMLQRMFKIGFNRAARIMDQLADAGVVGPEEGTKPRKVLMNQEEFGAYMQGKT